jgi:hypothetical protein
MSEKKLEKVVEIVVETDAVKDKDGNLHLTIEEAKALKKLLNGLFKDGDEVRIIREDHYHHEDHYYPWHPYRVTPYWSEPYYITYNTTWTGGQLSTTTGNTTGSTAGTTIYCSKTTS